MAWRIVSLGAVGSTNDEARRLAADGAPHGAVVVAAEQRGGRGRGGRGWASPPGNLYLSAVLRPGLPAARLAELSFVAALAVADAVDALLPVPRRAALKWPNDVLVDGAKIAGILVETEGEAAIVGIGLNVLHRPAGTPYPATSLAEHGALTKGTGTGEGPAAAAQDALLAALAARLRQWQADGFGSIRTDWLARAHPPGTRLHVRGPELDGAFAGLDADGALLLDTEAGRVRVVAGDVLQ